MLLLSELWRKLSTTLVTVFCAASSLDVSVTPAHAHLVLQGVCRVTVPVGLQPALSKLLDIKMIIGALVVNAIQQRRLNSSFIKGRQAYKSVRAL